MIGYLSGPITGNKDYKQQFARAAEQLAGEGYKVINPAALDAAVPEGTLTYEQIVAIDLELLALADCLIQLPGWEDSRGANRELGFALGTGMDVYVLDDILKEGGGGHGTAGDL